MMKRTRLSNGLTVICVSEQTTQTVTVMVLVPVGSRYETPSSNGIAHFLEHLMFKGTEQRPSTLDISKALDGVGAEFNAYTAKDHTMYFIKVAAQHLELALDLFSDMLFHSLFDAKEIERERGVIIEELNMYADNPSMHIETMIEMTVFGKQHSLGYDIGGRKSTIQRLARARFIEFKKRYYSPKLMHVVLAGRIPPTGLTLVKKYFGSYRYTSPLPVYRKFHSPLRTIQFNHQPKSTQQTQLAFGCIGLPYQHRDLPTLVVLATILGGNMSSRLFINVRERQGLCYAIHSEVTPYLDTGIITVQAGVDNQRVAAAVTAIVHELRQCTTAAVTAEELHQAKEFIKGQLALKLEDSSALAGWYGKQSVLTGRVISPSLRIRQIKRVTAADILRVARSVFQRQALSLASIGPQRSLKHLSKILEL